MSTGAEEAGRRSAPAGADAAGPRPNGREAAAARSPGGPEQHRAAPPARLEREFYGRDSRALAPELLNKVLVLGPCAGRIVEVEAYSGGGGDPASHAHRGPTRRNASMFGPPGHLYVYRSYGMHWCANVVCAEEGQGEAVLLRALAPLAGLELMAARRPRAQGPEDLCRGPGKLCQALGIDASHDGTDLVAGRDVALVDGRRPPPTAPGVGPRVGITVAVDLPWRWWVEGDPHVSRPRRARPPRRPG